MKKLSVLLLNNFQTKKIISHYKLMSNFLAEGVGFEPTDTFVSPVFKTGAFGRSATPPLIFYFLLIKNSISLSCWSRKIL